MEKSQHGCVIEGGEQVPEDRADGKGLGYIRTVSHKLPMDMLLQGRNCVRLIQKQRFKVRLVCAVRRCRRKR